MKIKKILFPTDFSETTVHTAAFAADLAGKYGASIYILHVIYDITRDSGIYGSRMDLDSLYLEVRKSAETEMDRIASAFAENLEVRKVIRIGSPYSDILSFADEESIDLIVIGSHGKKGLGEVLFGSTAHKVIRRAKCPVLTVRER